MSTFTVIWVIRILPKRPRKNWRENVESQWVIFICNKNLEKSQLHFCYYQIYLPWRYLKYQTGLEINASVIRRILAKLKKKPIYMRQRKQLEHHLIRWRDRLLEQQRLWCLRLHHRILWAIQWVQEVMINNNHTITVWVGTTHPFIRILVLEEWKIINCSFLLIIYNYNNIHLEMVEYCIRDVVIDYCITIQHNPIIFNFSLCAKCNSFSIYKDNLLVYNMIFRFNFSKYVYCNFYCFLLLFSNNFL